MSATVLLVAFLFCFDLFQHQGYDSIISRDILQLFCLCQLMSPPPGGHKSLKFHSPSVHLHILLTFSLGPKLPASVLTTLTYARIYVAQCKMLLWNFILHLMSYQYHVYVCNINRNGILNTKHRLKKMMLRIFKEILCSKWILWNFLNSYLIVDITFHHLKQQLLCLLHDICCLGFTVRPPVRLDTDHHMYMWSSSVSKSIIIQTLHHSFRRSSSVVM
jgi:hypothetical protein